MFNTRICDILEIEYPIILGGMVWICSNELAAAVSEAGGLGTLAGGSMMPDELRKEISLVKEKTKKTFCVNIPLLRPDAEELIDISIDGGASVIATSAGNPKRFTKKIKDAGLKVIHVSPNVKLAMKGAGAGVDALVAEGVEAGGHNGFDEITTMALVPQVVDKVDIPVIAAGGIADSRGFVAALALGAEGVQMGTRFVATFEAKAHKNFKDAILNAIDISTIITARTLGPTRCIKNALSEKILEAEKGGVTTEELLEMIGEGRSRKAAVDGDCDKGTVYSGQIGGLITELKSSEEVIEDIIEGAKVLVKTLAK
jgi:enoyl-[acyl-carrier protein] reductase II